MEHITKEVEMGRKLFGLKFSHQLTLIFSEDREQKLKILLKKFGPSFDEYDYEVSFLG